MGTERVTRSDAVLEDVHQADADIAARIDAAVARADFATASVPDFTAALPDPHRVLDDLAAHVQRGAQPGPRLREALAELDRALDEER